ncbi:MAG: DUF3810 domain-containing protein [Ruminococcaceae bacterium]|nr:DUF3810 domain-containing protein [Oscillospiraceae bacterium]
MYTGFLSGFNFIDFIVSEFTMAAAAVAFLLCAFLLVFKRKKLGARGKTFAVTTLVITGIYLGFIIFLAIMWGSQMR